MRKKYQYDWTWPWQLPRDPALVFAGLGRMKKRLARTAGLRRWSYDPTRAKGE